LNPMFNCNNVFWILEKGQKKWRWRLAKGYIMLRVSKVHLGTPISFFKSSSYYFMSWIALDYPCKLNSFTTSFHPF
jgi:hypothetical protein